ncbi:MAG: helix-turn-helix transcriptional regulator [Clostridia bacterium]|nr:helix-turn-helix transcriptional regulator [Clostridia bacterium]
MRQYYFRSNDVDFRKWCRYYVGDALRQIYSIETAKNVTHLVLYQNEYHEALRIKRQYEVLRASLTDSQRELLDRLRRGTDYDLRNPETNYDYWEIFHNWQEICFPKSKPRIKTIDDVLLGRILWEQRLRCDLSAAQVSELLHIAPGTLYAYEHGTRPIKLNTLYGMSQMYGISIDELIQKHFL